MLTQTNTYYFMKTKTITTIICLLCLANTALLKAQSIQESEYDYIYQIEVALVSNQKPVKSYWKNYKNLQDLGEFFTYIISQETPELPTKHRILLGRYVGKSTADRILAEVKKRGYKDARIWSDGGFQLGHSTGKDVKYGLQMGAFKSLNQVNVQQYLKYDKDTILYIQYKGGAYKVFMGLYAPYSLASVKTEMVPWYRQKGMKVFVQKFR
ncbi:hypothetical protein M23134_07133 [Microscilla marina ATCC 23134]|uniref:SPOR domain-containing protein n=2 Tax=Microscilla marina TaxID=1027 RepID=A1ZUG5_MICM2|nr:hypothetical protein M23134_07133 [Microscilla marina ATCC 23134]